MAKNGHPLFILSVCAMLLSKAPVVILYALYETGRMNER